MMTVVFLDLELGPEDFRVDDEEKKEPVRLYVGKSVYRQMKDGEIPADLCWVKRYQFA